MKNIITVLLSAVLVLSLASCSGSKSDTKKSAKDTESKVENTITEANYENLSPSEMWESYLSAEKSTYTQKISQTYKSSPDTTYTSVNVYTHDGKVLECGEYDKETYVPFAYFDFENGVRYRDEHSNNYTGWHSVEIPEYPDFASWVNNGAIKEDLGDYFIDENYTVSDDGTYTWNSPEALENSFFDASETKNVTFTSIGTKYIVTVSAETSSRIYELELTFDFSDTNVSIPESVIEEANNQ